LLVFFVVGSDRLQSLANLLLFSAPLAWLLYRTRNYEALYEESAAERAATAAGSAFLTDLLIAVVVAFGLQAIYAFAASRYGIDGGTRKLLGAGAIAATIVLGAVGGYASFFAGSGGPETPAGAEGGRAGIQDRLTSFDSLRYEYWKAGLEAWRENPITGTGAGTFQYTWLQERSIDTGVKQIHNLYLEQGTETGILAFAALAAFAALLAFYTAASAFRTPHSAPGEAGSGGRTLLAGLSGAIVLYLASSALEWHWYIPASTLYFFVLAAVAVKYASFEVSRDSESVANTEKREKGEFGEEHEGLGERARDESSEA
jgi:O-antigen ligase